MQLVDNWQEVVRQLSGSCQAVVRQLSGSCQAVVRQLSGSCQVVVRQSSGRLAVNEKMNQWFQGTPEKSCLVNRGRGRGQTGNLLQGTEGDIPRLQ
jgi:hypothetical protein